MRIVIVTVLLAVGVAGIAWAEWEPDVRLTSDPANSYVYVSNARRVAATESRVYAVWQDDRDGNWEVYCKVRTLAGWGPDNRLSTNDSASRYPAVAADSDYVYVVWQDRLNEDDEVFYMRSTDRGLNWTGSRLTEDDSFPSMHVAVAAWGPVVHVAWEDFRDGAPELYYARSTDAGTTWGRTRLTSDDNFMSQFPALAISGSHVHVVWHDNRDGNWEIYYMRSLD
ncbi:MAG: hypothetical protein JSU73_04490, partial [candidate division WOR-3 bacterium]